jgi:ribosomal protein L9
MRKKYQDDDLRTKMLRISKKLKEEGKIYGSG